jgi:signal transduction histidine kinase
MSLGQKAGKTVDIERPSDISLGSSRPMTGSSRPMTDPDQNSVVAKYEKLQQENIRLKAELASQHELERQLHQVQKMEAIGTLTAGIAHDFNNILSAVIGFSELALTESTEGTRLHDNIREILHAGYRAKDLVHYLLSFSRRNELESTFTKIKPLLKEALRFLGATLPATIEIRVNLQSDAAVWGDPSQIHQVIMNLCTNAAQAMSSGGVLSVALSNLTVDQEEEKTTQEVKQVEYVVLKVSDTGPGIPPEIMDRIFEPFFTTKVKGEGTGMGLSVVQRIVSNCGGKIRVGSQSGKGTTFQVYLPLFRERRKCRKAPPASLPTGSERILVVDDEPAVVKVASRMLEALGYQVETSTDPKEAKKRITEQPDQFDLVIIDMMMPKITGDVLARSLLRIRADLPILLLTGFDEPMNDQKIREIGLRAIIRKPFLKRTLAETIRQGLDHKSGDGFRP